MASIREKRPGVWEVRVHVGGNRYVSRTVTGGKREAQRHADRLQVEHAGTTSGDPTLGQLLDRWLGHIERRDRSPNTLAEYRRKIELYLPESMRVRKVSRLTTSELDQLYDDLAAKPRELAPATIRQLHSIVRAALHQGERWGLVTRNVASLASPPSVAGREQHPPTTEQVRAALEAAFSLEVNFAEWLHLAVITGARRAELCALRWSDLNADAGTLLVERSVTFVDGGPELLPTKTRGTRAVHLDAATLAMLAARHERKVAEAKAARVRLRADAFMFSDDPAGGLPIDPGRVTGAWARLRKPLGLGDVRLHDLRHYAATQLLVAGVPLPVVATRLGHAGGGTTTLKVYAHTTVGGDQAAAEVLGAALSG